MKTIYEVFIGRLGKRPDLRYTTKREPVCYLSVAVKKNEGTMTEWRRVVVWGKQAELCSSLLKKGSQIFV